MKLIQRLIYSCSLYMLALGGLDTVPVFAEPSYVLNAGGFDADAYWPVLVAQEKGFFAKEGIQIRSIRTDKAMLGLLAGSFEVINAGATAAILAAEKGANIAIPYVLSERPAQYMVLRKPLTMLRELEGETIGVFQIPSTVQLFIKNHLQKNDIDLRKISFRATGGSPERFASLLAGQSGATLLSTTYAFRAQQAGLKIVTAPADWEQIPWNVVTFRRLWLEANSPVVVKYLRALRLATLWLYDPVNFDDALRTLMPLSRLDENTIRWGLKSLVDNQIFNLNKPDPKTFQTLVSWLLTERVLSKQVTAVALVDTRYYDLAVKR
jgi:ABC-type nitrate/sulfonate/bicarbonate transport system substrate-binding protein